jgi:hypothetical protein
MRSLEAMKNSSHIRNGLVSTIIPVHNRLQLLREAVDSVLAQTYRPIELIIVDDGSTDDTGAVADQIQAEHPDQVRVLHPPNSGPGPAREAGRQIAKGEFIQYLDSDDLLQAQKFEWQVAALRERPECGVAYGHCAYQESGERLRYPWRRTGEAIDTMFPAFAADRWWGTSTPLYRRAVTDQAGPWLNLINCEDWEYDCRIAALHISLAYVPRLLSTQRSSAPVRLSTDGHKDVAKLQARAAAHQHIATHIARAQLDFKSPEVRQFCALTFLLARQCGAGALATESEKLMELVRELGQHTIATTARYKLYYVCGKLLGWSRVGRLADQRDRRNAGKGAL